jgi:RHS repeat-associated protein
MQSKREPLLCRYHYDPLDRLVDRSGQASEQRFYLKDRLATEIQGARRWSIIQHEERLFAVQQHQGEATEISLLATDQQRSILNLVDPFGSFSLAYTPYGHRTHEVGLLSLLGFNGERPDPLTGHYLLGNGYRAFNPVLMRFNSPDSLSPFGDGGLNAYTYCAGDPLNRRDDSGHVWKFLAALGQRFNRASSNGFTRMRRISDTSTSLNSVKAVAQPSVGGKGSTGSLLSVKKPKEIAAIKNRLDRNEAKLSNVKNELINLREQPEEVVRRTVELNPDASNLIGREGYESIVRKKIPARIEQLEKHERHYETKLNNIKAEALRVRNTKTKR